MKPKSPTANPAAIKKLEEKAEAGQPTAQFRVGMLFLTGEAGEHDPARGRQWMEKAADQGLTDAQRIVGVIYARGMDVEPDMDKAFQLLSRASSDGDSEASWHLGELFGGARDEGFDAEAAVRALRTAAEGGELNAMAQLAYCLEQGLGLPEDRVEAAAWWQRSAARGHARSLLALAERIAHGVHFKPDQDQAVWLAREAQRRKYLLADEYAADLVAALGREPDPERRKLPAEGAILQESPGQLPRPRLRTLSWAPRIFVVDDLLSTDECAHICNLSAIHLVPSMVVQTGGQQGHNRVRTSHEIRLRPGLRDTLVNNVERRMADYSHHPVEHAELPLVLRYQQGQEFKPHVDYFDTRDFNMGEGPLELGGQRIATQLVYLNQAYEGGETEFPKADISVSARRGMAIQFYNVLPTGHFDELTRHAGTPITRGEKWLLSRWIRQADADKPLVMDG